MKVNVREYLGCFVTPDMLVTPRLPDVSVDPGRIRAVMINEVASLEAEEDFYGARALPGYLKTTLALFRQAGAEADDIGDILARGIYITNAVKAPKTGYSIDSAVLKAHLPLLEKELALFPDLRAIMLMGDVAKKSFNMITKKITGKNAIPSGATYRLRNQTFYYGGVRVFPSYIMTGGNILIEKSKFAMAAEDIRHMLQLL